MSHPIVLGIDEVGRGPWAGPLVVGAVILGKNFVVPELANLRNEKTSTPENANLRNREGTNLRNEESASLKNEETTILETAIYEHQQLWQNLTDSKKLTAKKRNELNTLILRHAAAAATGWVSVKELDQYGLGASLKLATRRAVKQILAQKVSFDEVIIDGTINFLKNTPLEDRVTLLKKADLLIKEVSAASIIAKVARDNYMVHLAEKYPSYGFDKHVGYGTAAHKQALENYGICPEHRQSFRPIREIIAKNASAASRIPTSSKAPSIPNTPEISENSVVLKSHYSENLVKTAQSTTSKGKHAENLVADYLKSTKHTIITQNFKTKTYEIDLISTKNSQIYFTEVKYRQDSWHGSALEQITQAKQKQMQYAAEKFLSSHSEYQNFHPALAVASVQGKPPMLETWFPLD